MFVRVDVLDGLVDFQIRPIRQTIPFKNLERLPSSSSSPLRRLRRDEDVKLPLLLNSDESMDCRHMYGHHARMYCKVW